MGLITRNHPHKMTLTHSQLLMGCSGWSCLFQFSWGHNSHNRVNLYHQRYVPPLGTPLDHFLTNPLAKETPVLLHLIWIPKLMGHGFNVSSYSNFMISESVTKYQSGCSANLDLLGVPYSSSYHHAVLQHQHQFWFYLAYVHWKLRVVANTKSFGLFCQFPR